MKNRNGTPRLQAFPIPTSDGVFVARYSADGLAELDFPSKKAISAKVRASGASAPILEWHRMTTNAVAAALKGERPKKLPPLDISTGTAFRRKVWRALQEIPPGQTVTYGELSRAIGAAGAFRAVGGACGANPIPLLIPCHRVIAAGGKPGGFSGGPGWKQLLLHREGAPLANSGRRPIATAAKRCGRADGDIPGD